MRRRLNAEEKDMLVRARVKAFTDFPVFAHIMMYFDPVVTDEVPTAGITGKGKLFLNEKFISQLNLNSWVFVLVHESMHIVTMTTFESSRSASVPRLNKALWNIASDCAINQLITKSEIPLPTPEELGGMKIIHKEHDQFWAKYDDWTSEKIYYDLFENASFVNVQGGEGGASTGGDEDGSMKGYWWDSAGDEDAEEQKAGGVNGQMTEEEIGAWKSRIASAHSRAKAAGKMPGALDAFLTNFLQPKKNWKNYLKIAASTHLKGNWSWKVVSRRTAGGAIRTPGREKALPTAAMYIDTSGSMSDDELIRCISECAEIIKLSGGVGRLLLGDCEIYYDGEVDVNALRNLNVQRGGTDFRVLFDKIAEGQKKPNILIGFSDLCGPFPDKAPDYPVIWCVPSSSIGGQSAPFGSTIEVEL